MGKVQLYTAKLSPPGRAVELTAKAIGLDLDVHPINLIAGDHLKPEFVKVRCVRLTLKPDNQTLLFIYTADESPAYDSVDRRRGWNDRLR